jgi:hypothetical protein
MASIDFAVTCYNVDGIRILTISLHTSESSQ